MNQGHCQSLRTARRRLSYTRFRCARFQKLDAEVDDGTLPVNLSCNAAVRAFLETDHAYLEARSSGRCRRLVQAVITQRSSRQRPKRILE